MLPNLYLKLPDLAAWMPGEEGICSNPVSSSSGPRLKWGTGALFTKLAIGGPMFMTHIFVILCADKVASR